MELKLLNVRNIYPQPKEGHLETTYSSISEAFKSVMEDSYEFHELDCTEILIFKEDVKNVEIYYLEVNKEDFNYVVKVDYDYYLIQVKA